MLGGVAAGIAETYGIDVTLVRVLWVVAGVLWIGVPAYIVAWIAIAPGDRGTPVSASKRDPKMILGLALVALGALIAGNRVLPHGFHFGHLGAPFVLIGGGIAILMLRRRDEHDNFDHDDFDHGSGSDLGPSEPPVSTLADTTSPATPDAPVEDTATQPATGIETGIGEETPTEWNGFTHPTAPIPPVPPSAWTQTTQWPAPPSTETARALRRASRDQRRASRQRSFITPLTLSILLIGAGIASLLQATGALDVNLTVVLAIATCVVGAALVVSAFVGGARLLILVGLLLVAATSISNTLDVPLRGGIGRHDYHPLQLADLQSRYELGIGDLRLDLRDVPLANRTTVVDAQDGIGELEVFVPSTVRVEVHARAAAGSLMLFGRDNGGWPEEDRRAIDGSGPGVLQLDLRVGAGQVTVRRFEPGGIETIYAAGGRGTAVGGQG